MNFCLFGPGKVQFYAADEKLCASAGLSLAWGALVRYFLGGEQACVAYCKLFLRAIKQATHPLIFKEHSLHVYRRYLVLSQLLKVRS